LLSNALLKLLNRIPTLYVTFLTKLNL